MAMSARRSMMRATTTRLQRGGSGGGCVTARRVDAAVVVEQARRDDAEDSLADACCAARELLLANDGPLAGGISEARVYVNVSSRGEAGGERGEGAGVARDEWLEMLRMAGPAHEAEEGDKMLRLNAEAAAVLSAFAVRLGGDASASSSTSTPPSAFPALSDSRRALVMPFMRRGALLGVFVLDWAPGDAQRPSAGQLTFLRCVSRLVSAAAAADALREEERGAEKARLGKLVEELGAPLSALRTLAGMLVTQLQPEEPKADLIRGMLDVSVRLKQLSAQLQGAVSPSSAGQLPGPVSGVGRVGDNDGSGDDDNGGGGGKQRGTGEMVD